ncbi:DUF4132 domain-containing protein [Chloroflexia bacterium SDU3-3]|nr:DUF4132 domain-containing protein [Chloroflexia bacterium SDU3-3]
MTATATDHDRIRLELAPTDWFRAPWRNTPPLPRPPAPPFDREQALESIVKHAKYGTFWYAKKISVAATLTPREAHFWLLVGAALSDRRYDGSALYQQLIAHPLAGDLGAADVLAMLSQVVYQPMPWMIAAAQSFCAPAELVQWLIDSDMLRGKTIHEHAVVVRSVVNGFGQYVIPYLSLVERRAIGQQIRPHLLLADFPRPRAAVSLYERTDPIPMVFYLAALFGGSEDVLCEVLERLPDNIAATESWSEGWVLEALLLGLGGPEQIMRQRQRLGIVLRGGFNARLWLAATAGEDLAGIYSGMKQLNSDGWGRSCFLDMAGALPLVICPETARIMLELEQDPQLISMAREWLDAHVEQAIAGLAPLAAADHELAAAAMDRLRRYARRGHGALVAAQLGALPPAQAQRIREQALADACDLPPMGQRDTPAWLAAAAASAPRLRPVAWLKMPDLPPLVVGGHRLAPEHVSAVVAAIQSSPMGARPPLVELLRQHASPASCAAFAWAIFEDWLAARGPNKDKWGIGVLVQLGGDGVPARLGPLVHEWPAQSQHARAWLGVDCLRMIGSDAALRQLSSIAKTVKFLGTRKRASQHMDAIASERGLTRADLEDRIVPDCGLDAGGGRVFDYGPRQFRFMLRATMRPALRDDRGRVLATLPRPNARDDATLAATAMAQWRQLREQVAAVSKAQAVRLEEAMVDERRWGREAFAQALVRHPLLGHLVQRLVWAAYDAQGQLAATFRVDQDGAYADSSDRPIDLAAYPSVGIPHPLALSKGERAAWGSLLADYQIFSPFPQLTRPHDRFTRAQRGRGDLNLFGRVAIPAADLQRGLEQRGWLRGAPGDGTWFNYHIKPLSLPQMDITAIVKYDPGVHLGTAEAEDQRLAFLTFMPSLCEPSYGLDMFSHIPLGYVPKDAVVEMMEELAAVMEYGHT